MEVTDISTYVLIGAGVSALAYGVPYLISLGIKQVFSWMS